MCTPTHRIKLIIQTQTQDTLPTRCNNPQVETSVIKICVPVYGKTGCPDSEVSGLLPHYPWRGSYGEWVILKWRRLKMAWSQCVLVSDRVCRAAGRMLTQMLKLVSTMIRSQIISKQNLIQTRRYITWGINLSVYIRVKCCFVQISSSKLNLRSIPFCP